MSFLIGPAISAGTSIIGGLLGSNSANKAAASVNKVDQAAGSGIQQTAAANQSQELGTLNPYLSVGQTGATGYAAAEAPGGALNNFTFNPTATAASSPVTQALQPAQGVGNAYAQAGQSGISQLQTALAPGGSLGTPFSFDPSQIVNNPNYQFTLQQGEQAVQQSAAANGMLYSGGTLKALDQYSQGLATNTINDAYNQALQTYNTNYGNTFQGLNTLVNAGTTGAGIGNATANTLGNAVNSGYAQQSGAYNTNSQNYLNQIGIGQNANQQQQSILSTGLAGQTTGANYYVNGATAAANGQLAGANQIGNMIGGVGNAALTAYNNFTGNQSGNLATGNANMNGYNSAAGIGTPTPLGAIGFGTTYS